MSELDHPWLDPAGEESRIMLVEVAADTIMLAQKRGLAQAHNAGPIIGLEDGHLCLHNVSNDPESIGLISSAKFETAASLAASIRYDTDNFPDFSGWSVGAALLARAVITPKEVLPVDRMAFTFVCRFPTCEETNSGVQYLAADKTKVRIDTIAPTGVLRLSNFAVGAWMDRLRRFRNDHGMPPHDWQ